MRLAMTHVMRSRGRLVLVFWPCLFFAVHASAQLISCKELTNRWNEKLRFDIHDNEDLDADCQSTRSIVARGLFTLDSKLPHLYRFVTARFTDICYVDVNPNDPGAIMSTLYGGCLHVFHDVAKPVWKSLLDLPGGFASIYIGCLLVHEASHVGSSGTHEVCKHGQDEGNRGCDDRYYGGYQGGGYSFETACLIDYYNLGRKDSSIDQRYMAKAIYTELANNFNEVNEVEVAKWKAWGWPETPAAPR